jgi:hypothetical protein
MVERVDAIRQELFENNWSYKDSPGYPRMVKHLCVNFNHKTDRFGNLVILERIGVSSLKTLCADVYQYFVVSLSDLCHLAGGERVSQAVHVHDGKSVYGTRPTLSRARKIG